MISYKDQTFCSSDCINDKCFRNYTDVIHRQAREWWGRDGVSNPDNAPVAFSDFSKGCEAYMKGK